MFGHSDNTGEWTIYVEDTDNCSKCNLVKDCPLIEALTFDIVGFNYDSIDVKQCRVYNKYGKTNLRVVK